MSQEETANIMHKAEDCVAGECSLDQIDDLIDVLKSQQRELYDRVNQVKEMVETLEKVNSKADERSVDEVRETVRAIFRVFQLGDKVRSFRVFCRRWKIVVGLTLLRLERTISDLMLLYMQASGNDFPSLSKPTGWSGEVGSGPTTAYDALPPKQMKKTP